MFRRVRLNTYESLEGKEIKHYGVVDLPSDGMIHSYKGVIDGLRKRGGIEPEVARRYRRILNAGNPVECKGIILELNILLDKSPSPRNADRVRNGRRRYRSASQHTSARGLDDWPMGYHTLGVVQSAKSGTTATSEVQRLGVTDEVGSVSL